MVQGVEFGVEGSGWVHGILGPQVIMWEHLGVRSIYYIPALGPFGRVPDRQNRRLSGEYACSHQCLSYPMAFSTALPGGPSVQGMFRGYRALNPKP